MTSHGELYMYRGAITIGENISMSTAYRINRDCEQTGNVDSEAPRKWQLDLTQLDEHSELFLVG